MMLFAIYVLAPIVVYVSLVCLPRGRPALIGIAAAAALLAVLWLAVIRGQNDAFLAALVAIVAGAVAVAALAQGLRTALGPGSPRWLYPAIAVLAVFGAGVPALATLGL